MSTIDIRGQGQANFTSGASATTQNGMNGPQGLYVDSDGRLWVGDYLNSRVLRFESAASKANGANADGVLGQADFISNGTACTQSGMNNNQGVAMDLSGRLYVGDCINNRVLIFNNAEGLANGANANYVLGQTDFITCTAGTSATTLNIPVRPFFDPAAEVLWVSERGNYRVLMFGEPNPKPIPTMTEWGMIILVALLGIGSFYYLRRRRLAV